MVNTGIQTEDEGTTTADVQPDDFEAWFEDNAGVVVERLAVEARIKNWADCEPDDGEAAAVAVSQKAVPDDGADVADIKFDSEGDLFPHAGVDRRYIYIYIHIYINK